MRRPSLPSFLAGFVVALVLAAIPATAVLQSAAVDANPNTFDGTSPSLSLKPVTFVTGGSIDAAADPAVNPCGVWNMSIPLILQWSGSDAVSGLASYDLWESADWAGESEVLHATSATSYRFSGNNYDGACGNDAGVGYWVVAHDNRGNSATTAQAGDTANVWQENGYEPYNGTAVRLSTKTGTWSTSNCTCFNGGHTSYSTAAGAALTYTVTTGPGQTVALVMEKNTNRGVANISVDGAAATQVNTYASTATHRIIVWQKTINTSGTHTIKITNAGTAGRSRIDVDSILLK